MHHCQCTPCHQLGWCSHRQWRSAALSWTAIWLDIQCIQHIIKQEQTPVCQFKHNGFTNVLSQDCICITHLTWQGVAAHKEQLVIQLNNSKAVPLQAWTGPEGSRKLRFPDYMTTAQDSSKVVSLTHRPLFTPRKYSWYSFLLEAESTPGP